MNIYRSFDKVDSKLEKQISIFNKIRGIIMANNFGIKTVKAFIILLTIMGVLFPFIFGINYLYNLPNHGMESQRTVLTSLIFDTLIVLLFYLTTSIIPFIFAMEHLAGFKPYQKILITVYSYISLPGIIIYFVLYKFVLRIVLSGLIRWFNSEKL